MSRARAIPALLEMALDRHEQRPNELVRRCSTYPQAVRPSLPGDDLILAPVDAHIDMTKARHHRPQSGSDKTSADR